MTVTDDTKSDKNTCCKHHSCVELDYEKEGTPFYWTDVTKKFYGKPCKKCDVQIGTKESTGGNLTMIKPTAKAPVFVCKKFAKGHSTCGHIVCNGCWQKELGRIIASTSGATRSRRAQRGSGN